MNTPVENSRSSLLRAYENHPLSADAILRRLASDPRSNLPVTELDLAVDNVTGVTDQNHVGGIHAVRRLARLASIRRESHVVDLMCGLGGSARVLALEIGCHVLGVELSPFRCRDAQRLTKVTGLTGHVSIRCGDVTSMPLPQTKVDVLWGQSAWVHAVDKHALVNKWRAALTPNGVVAVEDTAIQRHPTTYDERTAMSELEAIWHSHIVDITTWTGILARNGLKPKIIRRRPAEFRIHFKQLLRFHRNLPGSHQNALERRASLLALRLAERGVLTYFSIVAEPMVAPAGRPVF
jgi:SAM-dependent methyltransferase